VYSIYVGGDVFSIVGHRLRVTFTLLQRTSSLSLSIRVSVNKNVLTVMCFCIHVFQYIRLEGGICVSFALVFRWLHSSVK